MASETTLELRVDGTTVFASSGKWLHPLFELEQFLAARRIDRARAEIRDKIVGRGSAFLIVRMGIRTVRAGILSRLGRDVLDRAGAACSWESLVDRIQCRTESLLSDTTDPEEAYRILADLAQRDTRKESAGSSSGPAGPSVLRGRRSS